MHRNPNQLPPISGHREALSRLHHSIAESEEESAPSRPPSRCSSRQSNLPPLFQAPQSSLFQAPQSSLFQAPQSSLFQASQSSLFQASQSPLFQTPEPSLRRRATTAGPVRATVMVAAAVPANEVARPASASARLTLPPAAPLMKPREVDEMLKSGYLQEFAPSELDGLEGLEPRTEVALSPASSSSNQNHSTGFFAAAASASSVQPMQRPLSIFESLRGI